MDSTTRMELQKTDVDTWNLEVLVAYFDLEQVQVLEVQSLYFDFLKEVEDIMGPSEKVEEE